MICIACAALFQSQSRNVLYCPRCRLKHYGGRLVNKISVNSERICREFDDMIMEGSHPRIWYDPEKYDPQDREKGYLMPCTRKELRKLMMEVK